jgi:phage shock protein A
MSILRKLHTLARAGVREGAAQITEANAIRIYRQEVVDAEALLVRRRTALGAMIATRKDLEREICAARARLRAREAQIARLAPADRSEELLRLAAQDIAATEAHVTGLENRKLAVVERIHREERCLRNLLAEVREHRREVGILAAQLAQGGGRVTTDYGETVAGHLATLRATRASLGEALMRSDYAEEGMAEAMQRVEGDPLEQALSEAGRDDASLRVAQVLARLRSLPPTVESS